MKQQALISAEPGTQLLTLNIRDLDRIEIEAVPVIGWVLDGDQLLPLAPDGGYETPIVCRVGDRCHAQSLLYPPVTPERLLDVVKGMFFSARIDALVDDDLEPDELPSIRAWEARSRTWAQLGDVPGGLAAVVS